MNQEEEQIQQAQDVQNKENKILSLLSSKFILIGAALVLIIAGAITGGYFLGVKKTEPKACSLEAKICPDGSSVKRTGPNCEFSPCPSSSSKGTNNTANWKTYINQKFGFSMKYPIDWKVTENGNNSIWATNANNETLIIGVKNATDTVKITHSGTIVAKDFIKRGNVEFLGQLVEKDVLMFKSSDVSVMYDLGKEIPRGNLMFALSLNKTIFCLQYIGANCPNILSPASEIIADQILSTFKFTSTESSKAPSDWSLTTDNECNVVFSIPPKKAPYYKPQTTAEASTLSDEGKYWMFEETENLQNLLFRKVKLVRFANPNEGGSGYVAGMVTVSCGQNEKGYTTDTLLEEFRSNFTDGTFQGLELASVNSETKWNRKVYEVSVKGGMSDKNNLEYLFATGKNVYRIGWVSMASNPFVKETTETIFNNLNFKD